MYLKWYKWSMSCAVIYFYFPLQLIMSLLVSNSNTNGLKLIYYSKICLRYLITDYEKDKLPGQKESTKHTEHFFENLKGK